MGTAVTLTTYQFAQVLGFAAGGAVTGFFGTRPSLLIDAATFAARRLSSGPGYAHDPPPRPHGHRQLARLAGLFAGARLVFARPALRTPMLFGWLAAFYDAPGRRGQPRSPRSRRRRGRRRRDPGRRWLWAKPSALSCSAASWPRRHGCASWVRSPSPPARCCALFFWQPGLPGSLLILFASGLGASYQIAANAAFVSAAPREQRGQAFGLAQGGISLGQGTAMILAGAAADHYSPASVIAISGTVGAAVALAIAVSWARARRQSADGHLQRLGSAPAGVAHGVLLLSCPLVGGGWVRVSPSRCRAWRAPSLVSSRGWRVGAGQPQPVSRMACSFSVRWWVPPVSRMACPSWWRVAGGGQPQPVSRIACSYPSVFGWILYVTI